MSTEPNAADKLEREIAEEFEPEAAVDQSAADVVEQLEGQSSAGDLEDVDIPLEDPSFAEALAELEIAVTEQAKELGRLGARIAHLEARTRDATINGDIVSLQGKVAGLEENVGAKHAPAIEELRTRVDALEAGT